MGLETRSEEENTRNIGHIYSVSLPKIRAMYKAPITSKGSNRRLALLPRSIKTLKII